MRSSNLLTHLIRGRWGPHLRLVGRAGGLLGLHVAHEPEAEGVALLLGSLRLRLLLVLGLTAGGWTTHEGLHEGFDQPLRGRCGAEGDHLDVDDPSGSEGWHWEAGALPDALGEVAAEHDAQVDLVFLIQGGFVLVDDGLDLLHHLVVGVDHPLAPTFGVVAGVVVWLLVLVAHLLIPLSSL